MNAVDCEQSIRVLKWHTPDPMTPYHVSSATVETGLWRALHHRIR